MPAAFHGGAAAPRYEIDRPQLSYVNGSFCVSVARSWVPDQAAAGLANAAAEGSWAVLTGQWGLCPGVTLPPRTGIPPAVVAAAFWQAHGEDLLARPAPRIAPGYALAGKTAYLETGGSTGQTFANPTPAGSLGVDAVGVFYVDWGDGSGVDGPFDTTGGPYPSGRITHVYDRVGTYTVTVTEQWSASWSLAGQRGRLSALRTVGAIAGFPVRQLESVRNR